MLWLLQKTFCLYILKKNSSGYRLNVTIGLAQKGYYISIKVENHKRIPLPCIVYNALCS